jgi:hypothetical protein
VRGLDLGLERLEPVDATCREGEVVALLGEDPGHPGTEAGARPGDEHVLAHLILLSSRRH